MFIDAKIKSKIKVFGVDYKSYLLERIDSENLPKIFGGSCECPGGCLFSIAGPWKKPDEIEENIPEDILKRRKEITDIMTLRKIQNDGQLKITGKEGINPEDL